MPGVVRAASARVRPRARGRFPPGLPLALPPGGAPLEGAARRTVTERCPAAGYSPWNTAPASRSTWSGSGDQQ
ncbi:hypothetical protein Sliba_18210 [Streptomyces nigrescens]|uniref:Uncharacterized protein n=1 Tax=Streptomyces nigrescens TaxID=1920 RepID=A0A640TDD4_STRNI|nr:hypothetical protein Sliba_18210 [Streptomyces libani subsp. libani]GGW02427.1 hypothetical protein GCM10010500_59800 [Streptomyces libani subsp. libani]